MGRAYGINSTDINDKPKLSKELNRSTYIYSTLLSVLVRCFSIKEKFIL